MGVSAVKTASNQQPIGHASGRIDVRASVQFGPIACSGAMKAGVHVARFPEFRLNPFPQHHERRAQFQNRAL